MRALLLLSGGIDSPVAGHIVKEKGAELYAVHFDNQPFSSDKAAELAKRLAEKIGVVKLFMVDYGKVKAEIVKHCTRRFTCVLCRRLMFRISEKIAQDNCCDFLVSGENLGQVASQTLSNMVAEHSAITLDVIRPLLCNDKQETIDLAKIIGTYEISIEPSICCTLVPKCPATQSKIERIESEENKLNFSRIVDECVSSMKTIYLNR